MSPLSFWRERRQACHTILLLTMADGLAAIPGVAKPLVFLILREQPEVRIMKNNTCPHVEAGMLPTTQHTNEF